MIFFYSGAYIYRVLANNFFSKNALGETLKSAQPQVTQYEKLVNFLNLRYAVHFCSPFR
jgi:hypothetical protein